MVDSGICSLAGQYDNPLPESTISFNQGLRMWPLYGAIKGENIPLEGGGRNPIKTTAKKSWPFPFPYSLWDRKQVHFTNKLTRFILHQWESTRFLLQPIAGPRLGALNSYWLAPVWAAGSGPVTGAWTALKGRTSFTAPTGNMSAGQTRDSAIFY